MATAGLDANNACAAALGPFAPARDNGVSTDGRFNVTGRPAATCHVAPCPRTQVGHFNAPFGDATCLLPEERASLIMGAPSSAGHATGRGQYYRVCAPHASLGIRARRAAVPCAAHSGLLTENGPRTVHRLG